MPIDGRHNWDVVLKALCTYNARNTGCAQLETAGGRFGKHSDKSAWYYPRDGPQR